MEKLHGYEEYNLNLRQKSIEMGIIFVKVDDLGTSISEDGLTYSTTVEGKETYPVEIKLKDEKAKARVEDKEGNIIVADQLSVSKGNISIECGETLELNIVVTSENGEERTYNLVVERILGPNETYIEGKILTENYEGKHIANVKVYRKEGEEKLLVKEVTTSEEGTYKLIVSVPQDRNIKYEIKITKLGYLSYEVTNIAVEGGKITSIPEYKLIAGDTVATEEIEIDDLVSLNDKFGITISGKADENKIYDLNEDGTVDNKDRNILKKNYGKMAEIKEM